MSVKSHATEEIKALRAILIARDWVIADLAQRVGLSANSLNAHFVDGFIKPRIQARVENAIGTALWFDPATFNRRQHAVSVLGFDPYVLTSTELRRRATALHIPGVWRRTRDALSEAILDFAAANPTCKQAL